MALVPLKQTITVWRVAGEDKYGEPIYYGEPLTFKCRVEETINKVTNQVGEEVISGMLIYLDKLADIRYDDDIKYTNELGVILERKPIKIEPIRMFSGKAAMTLVYC